MTTEAETDSQSTLLQLYKHFLENIREYASLPSQTLHLTLTFNRTACSTNRSLQTSRSNAAIDSGKCTRTQEHRLHALSLLPAGMQPSRKHPGEDIIDLPDEEHDDLDAILRFLYTVEYPYNDLLAAVTDVRVHTMAGKYEVPDLMKLAELRFAENVRKVWRLPEFAALVTSIYTEASDRDGKLTKALLDLVVEHAKELFEEDFGADFRTMARSNAAFMLDVNARLTLRAQEGAVWVSCCRACKNEWPQYRVQGETVCRECGAEGHSFLW